MILINNTYKPIPYKLEKILYDSSINEKYPFSKITDDQKSYLKKKYINNPKYKNYNISIAMIENIKKAYIREHVIKYHHKIINKLDKIRKLYKEDNIIELSNKYQYPPLTLLRLILDKDNKTFTKYINKEYDDKIKERDIKNIELGLKYDNFSVVDEKKQLEDATNFEKDIEKILIKNNIKYITQEELVQEQIKKYGKAINTPDFLLKTEIDNINWIDAKNFYGANTKFNKNKIQKQTEKYIKEYGNGLIIFNLGYSKELSEEFKNIKFISFNQL